MDTFDGKNLNNNKDSKTIDDDIQRDRDIAVYLGQKYGSAYERAIQKLRASERAYTNDSEDMLKSGLILTRAEKDTLLFFMPPLE